MNQRTTTLLAILLLVIIGWFLQPQERSQHTAAVSRAQPDNFVREMNLAIMDARGRPYYRIQAQHMLHDPDTDNLELENPVMSVMRADGDAWNITAEKGQIINGDDRLWLLGRVDIRRPHESTPLHIRTSTLLVKPDQQLAETGEAVEISSRHFNVNAVGMTADFRQNILKLHTQVQGTIDVAG